MNNPRAAGAPPQRTIDIVNASLKRRYAKERRFRLIGMTAVVLGLLFVALLFADIVGKGYTAFQQTYIRVPVTFDASVIDPAGTRDIEALMRANYAALIRQGQRDLFPEVTDRRATRALIAR